MPHTRTTRFLDELNHGYLALHTRKEDAFWTALMGLAPDAERAQAELDAREIELGRFLQDPARLAAVRAELSAAGAAGVAGDDELASLAGWRATFAAHAIESAQARALAERIVEAEGALARARASMQLGYAHPERGFVPASSVELGVLVATEPRDDLRRAAWEGLRRIEEHVLASGFLELVGLRNQLGRMLGAEDYYDWKVRRVEGMSKSAVFALLDELERGTRASAQRGLVELRERAGEVTPWSVRYLSSGDVTRAQDPYFPFGRALERFGRSFAALGVDFNGATLVLDLVDRPGKYENGFMHGPEVAWLERGARRPARIQFTANAIPGLVGSGRRATETLFHEGGHAAHFANVAMPAPCFGQEFAPTSVGFCETQSMLLESLLGDADWQARYAHTPGGEPMPLELVEQGIAKTQPLAAWGARGMLAVCYGERALYELAEHERTPAGALAALRAVERRLLFLDGGGPRPVLSVPHLIAGDASAYYHGYVLAEMAVQQTRAHFLARDGHLVDNPRLGPALREVYWRPGNSKSFDALVAELTGAPLGAGALVARLARSAGEAVAEARAALAREPSLPRPDGPVRLGARVRVAHGLETIAELEEDGDFDAFAREFERWIDGLVR